MKTMMLMGRIESPVDLDNEVWDELLRKINEAVKFNRLKITIKELGNKENRPRPKEVCSLN